MTSEKIAYPPQFFPELFLAYINKKESLTPFYNHFPDLEGFAKQIKEKQFSAEIRQDLHTVLFEQYRHLPEHTAVDKNIELLKEANTFTVTTGHQLKFIYRATVSGLQTTYSNPSGRRIKEAIP